MGRTLHDLSEALVAAVERADRGPSQDDWRTRRVDRGEVLAGLARSLILIGGGRTPVSRRGACPGHAEDVSAPIRAHAGAGEPSALARETREEAPPRPDDLVDLLPRATGVSHGEGPRGAKTFQRAAEIKCTCQDCAELKQFLKDPGESSHRFSMRQDRRDHLANKIRQHKCDLDCKTETRGSPHTLICTKNTASFQERVKEYHQNQEHLATVRAIEARLRR